jgi:hypothetical protein
VTSAGIGDFVFCFFFTGCLGLGMVERGPQGRRSDTLAALTGFD